MNICRTAAAMTAVAAMTALAACGNGEENGEPEDEDVDDAEVDTETENGEEEAGEDDLDIDEDDIDAVGGFEGESLTFVTGGVAGTYYPLGGEISTIIATATGADVNYVESGGSVDNLGQIYQGQAEIGLSQNDTANNAVNGELEGLEGEELDNFGWIANLYPEAMHIVVRSDSGIESVADLEGATIAVGDVGSGTRAISDAILAGYGIEEGDYDAEETDFGSSTEMLADGQIDATMFVVGVPVASLTELAATTDVELLSLEEDSAEEIAEGGFYEVYDVSADSYDFLDEDATTISVFAAVLASTDDIDEDFGYAITEAIFDNADAITLDVGESISLDEALNGIGDVPLHPGAQRYFDEQGIEQ